MLFRSDSANIAIGADASTPATRELARDQGDPTRGERERRSLSNASSPQGSKLELRLLVHGDHRRPAQPEVVLERDLGALHQIGRASCRVRV